MTIARDRIADGFAAATWAAAQAVGVKHLAHILGVNKSWIYKASHPESDYALSVSAALAADLACARAGGGTPHWDVFRRRLVQAGVHPLAPAEIGLTSLIRAVRAAADSALKLLGAAPAEAPHAAKAMGAGA